MCCWDGSIVFHKKAWDISEEIFDLFDRRKHNSAMIVTSNRDVDEWPQVFCDPILASAAIDRMFENANICLFEGPSHRMKGDE